MSCVCPGFAFAENEEAIEADTCVGQQTTRGPNLPRFRVPEGVGGWRGGGLGRVGWMGEVRHKN